MIFAKKYLRFLIFLILILIVSVVVYQNRRNHQNWQFLIKKQLGASSVLNVGRNLTFDEEKLYFSDGSGLIHALNKETGKIAWLHKLDNHSPFEITKDENALYIAGFDSHIYKLDKKNGYIIWSFSIPNQFWPDSEVIFDENDNLAFFADRGGFLYALDKETGKEIWKKEFGSIDTSKAFVENSIHFGFLKQEEDVIIADHFPSKTTFYINKKSGEILSSKNSELKINLKEIKEEFNFNNLSLKLESNIIDQPKINLFDQNNILLWSYRAENRTNLKEVYQDEQRLYYLNADNTILESIYIGKENPNKRIFKKVNFTLNENYAVHYPYKNSNPQANSEEIRFNLPMEINKKIIQTKYLFKNFKQLFSFSISHLIQQNYLEFNIVHEENFYNNVFNDVQIECLFKNQETNQKIVVKGFYYDHNTWKIRSKLPNGTWSWSIKIKTKYNIKKINGSIKIDENFKQSLGVANGSFIENNQQIFFPLGIQDVIMDRSKDGNNLNNMDYARDLVPSSQEKDFNFLNLPEYLDLYQKEAKLNIFRYGPDNWAPSIWEDLSSKKSFAMNVKGNLQGDLILENLQQKDFKVMMSIFAFYPPYTSREGLSKKENREVLEKYVDYIIARYAASIDIWELTNEAAPPIEWQNFISDYIAKNDPYKHPITTNLEQPNLNKSDLLSIHVYLQKPINNYHLATQLENLFNKQDPKKAIIISEFGFQESNYFVGSADWLRKFSWITALKNIGLISWNTGYGLYENVANGNVYLGPEERSYLKNLKDFLPKIEYPIEKNLEFTKNDDLAIYSLSDAKHDLFYILNLKKGQQISEHQLPVRNTDKKYVEIVNPKTGIILNKIDLTKEDQLIILPKFNDDLAIKVTYL